MAVSRPRTSNVILEKALKQVRDQSSFLQALLIDGLSWQLPEAAEQIEDIAFGWSQEDLRTRDLDRQLLDGAVWQLQPQTSNQPWGIFILEFNRQDVFTSGRGMTGPLRKVLRGLVPNRRKVPDSKSWRREHLLFICTHKYQNFRFAYFKSPPDKKTAEPLAAFGWGPNIPARTAFEYNLPELVWPADPTDSAAWVSQWAGAFDVEKVTRKFYDDYAAAFAEVEHKIKEGSGIKDKEELRLFTQTLFNRLMFLRFIERKGWLKFPGQKGTDYLAALAQAGGIGKKSIYQSRLRPLFFEGLAVEGKQESPAIGKVPFLNGGLFDATKLDEKVKDVPDAAILSVIGPMRLFYKYNFTVEESTPLDIEVAVDPEMLGKVFEELVTGRHESGSYYTPKPIVSFMCREALKHYLAAALPEQPTEALAMLVDDHDATRLTNAEGVFAALLAVKVCDPACGSGAYLLGMLHELLELRACLFVSQQVDKTSAYERKLQIIENCLYGVDKDEFAVNIARLRLWLSLAVEFDGDEPPSLPNLDFKIEVGDSLAAPDPLAAFKGQQAFRQDLLKQFRDKKATYIEAHGEDKKRLRNEIDKLRADLAVWLHSQAPEGAFDWATEFAEVFAPRPKRDGSNDAKGKPGMELGGFDIVVANPPYVRMELIKPLKPMLRRNFLGVHDERTDLYVYFFARAHELLGTSGVAAIISSNKWLRAGYGEKLRQHILDSNACHLVADFGDQPVFQSATAYACIFVWSRMLRANLPTRWAVITCLDDCYSEGVRRHIDRISTIVDATSFQANKPRLVAASNATSDRQMNAAGQRLGDLLPGKLFYGIKTGLNDAFVIDGSTRESLIAEDPASEELIRPLLFGTDIRRSEVQFRDKYIIYLPHSAQLRRGSAVERWLKPFKDRLENRATNQEWFQLQQPQERYAKQFAVTKIVYPDISKELRFAMDDGGHFLETTAFAIGTSDWYYLAILNSSATLRLLESSAAMVRGGYLRFKAQYVENIPIPDASSDDRTTVGNLARESQKLHTKRRKRVEAFLRKCGLEPADSSSRNPLEQPWLLEAPEFKKRVKQGTLAVYSAARDETAALTAEIEKLEAEIDARVAVLYGL